MKKLIPLTLAVVMTMAYSCKTTKKTPTEIKEDTKTTDVTKNTSGLTFEKHIKPIMKSKCGGGYCHHGPTSEFTSYDRLKKFIDNGKFKKLVFDLKTMPKGTKLSTEEFNTLKKWYGAGAPK